MRCLVKLVVLLFLRVFYLLLLVIGRKFNESLPSLSILRSKERIGDDGLRTRSSKPVVQEEADVSLEDDKLAEFGIANYSRS